MPTPTNRTPLRVARGAYSNLNGSLTDLQEGEIAFATDEGKLYVKQGAGLTSISSSSQAAPTPSDVTATPAFSSGTGTQADPFIITNGASPFAGGTIKSAQQITIANGNAGDLVVFTDNSAVTSDRYKGQEVGTINGAGSYTFNLNYTDTPNTTTNNTTYAGALQVGSVHFQWTVVQSNLTPLTQASGTTISGSVGAGNTLTAVEGTANGGTASISYATRWQRSFTGVDGFFDIAGATGTTYTQSNNDAGYFVRAVTTATDSTPSGQGGPLTLELVSPSSNAIPIGAAPVINNVVLSEDNTSGARFTSEAFNVITTMGNQGAPVSQKGYKGKVTATFQQFPTTNASTAVNITDTSTTASPATNIQIQSASNLSLSGNEIAVCKMLHPTTNVPISILFQWVSGSTEQIFVANDSDLSSWSLLNNSSYQFDCRSNHIAIATRENDHINCISKGSDKNCSFDVSDLFAGNPSKERALYFYTDKYKYRIETTYYPNHIYRTLRSTNASAGSLSMGGVSSGTNARSFMMEVRNDTVMVFAVSTSSNTLWFRELTDVKSDALNWNGGTFYAEHTISNCNWQDRLNQLFVHNNSVYASIDTQLWRFDIGDSSPGNIIPIPSVSGYSPEFVNAYLDANDEIVLRVDYAAGTRLKRHYKTNNGGATWVQQYFDESGYGYHTVWLADIYGGGNRYVFTQSSGYWHAKAYALGYQDITVTNGADLNLLNVGDRVKLPGVTDPRKFSQITTITDNGNSTTTIRTVNGRDAVVGETIEAVASTGSAITTRFLVIGATGTITSTQSTDPGFVQIGPGTSQQLTFPATFATGSAPDAELPAGTTLQVEIEASNTSASDTFPSNIITPA